MNGLTGRLLKLTDLLQGHTRLTTEEIAVRLGVSERTVRRDITRLHDLELNVEVTPGRGGGVTLQPGSLLPTLRFTDDEALALGFGLLLAGRTEEVALGRATESASTRLGGVLGERLRERLGALGRVLSEPPTEQREAAPVASSLIFDLAEATGSRRQLELSYRAPLGEITERRVDPYGLVHMGRYWYLTGYCHLRRDVRVFRLDRVRRARTTEASFVSPTDFDALRVVSRAIAGTSFPGAVTCHAGLQHRRGQPPHPGGGGDARA
jgi:predicted DNA-binding transcriptional regulator YafY